MENTNEKMAKIYIKKTAKYKEEIRKLKNLPPELLEN